MIFQQPNIDLDWYRPIWEKGKEQIAQLHPFSSFIDNPYLIAYEATNSLDSDQIVGNIFANITYGAFFWSATEADHFNAWGSFLNYNYGDVSRGRNFKSIGASVRCLRG